MADAHNSDKKDYTSIPIDLEKGDVGEGFTSDQDHTDDSDTKPPDVPLKDNFPTVPFSVDELIKKSSQDGARSKKLKKKTPLHSRQGTSQTPKPLQNEQVPMVPKAPSNHDLNKEPPKRHRRSRSYSQAFAQIQNQVKQIHLAQMPRTMMKNLNPTNVKFIDRFIKRGREIWPGHPKMKAFIYSPYFFLYIISMSLIQAFVAGIAPPDYYLPNGMDLNAVISLVFFILYILEVILRMYIKGFDFFLSLYNLAEVSLTFTAFILDFLVKGTSFVPMLLSLRIVWCIHKVPGMQFIVEGIKIAAPRISVILFPIFIIIYMFAVIATNSFGPASFDYPSPDYWKRTYRFTFDNGTSITVPGAGLPYDYYGNIPTSMFTLFQVVSGDAWADQIARPTMAYRPWSWLMFMIFYAVSNFLLLNIFTGIMVDAIQSYEADRRLKKEIEREEKRLNNEKEPKIKGSKSLEDTSKILKDFITEEDEDEDPIGSPAPLRDDRKGKSSDFKLSSRETFSSDEFGSQQTVASSQGPKYQNQSKYDRSLQLQTSYLVKELQILREENKKLYTKLLNKVSTLEDKLESK